MFSTRVGERIATGILSGSTAPAWVRYCIAVVSVGAATAAGGAIASQLQSAPYTPLFFCAVLFTAWFGGLGPGFLATVLSSLAFDYFFIEPTRSLILNEAAFLRLLVFFVTAAFAVVLAATVRRLTVHLRETHARLESAVQELKKLNTALQSENSERQRAEENSRRAERELQLIVDTIPVIAARYDREGRVDFVNQTWCAYTGATLQTADRHRWGVAIHPDDIRISESTWLAGLKAGSPFELEYRLRKADGTYRWFRVIRVPFKDERNQIVRWYAAAYDIEDNKRAFERLRRNESYLEVAQQLSRTGSIGWNPVEETVFWSKEAFHILGFDETVVPTLELLVERVHPQDREAVRQQLADVTSGRQRIEFETKLLMDNGVMRYVHVRARKEKYESGAEEVLGAVMDITEAKLAQLSLERVQTELAHANRIAALGEMSASIAHEVNQPLGAIAINGEVMLRLLSRQPPDVAESIAAAQQVVSDVRRATAVVARVRELSRKANAEMIRLDLNALVKDAVEIIRRDALRSEAHVSMSLAVGLQPVRGDRIQLQQVIVNLALNGLQAMEAVRDRPRLLTIRTEVHNLDEALVAVEDVGVGAGLEGAGRFFEAFYTTKQHGLGIGLSICRSIVDAHRGKIWGATNTGIFGMTFRFTIPFDQDLPSS